LSWLIWSRVRSVGSGSDRSHSIKGCLALTTTTHRFNVLVAFLKRALDLLVPHGRAIETNTCFKVGLFYRSWHVPPSRARRRTHCILRQPAGRSPCGAEGEEARLYAGACGLHRGLQAAVLTAPGNISSQTPRNRGCVCSRICFEGALNLFSTIVFYQDDSDKATIPAQFSWQQKVVRNRPPSQGSARTCLHAGSTSPCR